MHMDTHMLIGPPPNAPPSPTSSNSPLQSLNWVFGASASIRNNVVNLADGHTDRVCYLAAHTAVIYDRESKQQMFLQVSKWDVCI